MATRAHIDLLREGADAVAMWQATHPGEVLDLENADLRGIDLPEMLFVGAKLHKAEMNNANFSGSGFLGSDMREAELSRAKLMGAEMHGVDLSGADLSFADLSEADLRGAKLNGANLENARLVGAQLCGATLDGARMAQADLSDARLEGASILDTDLRATILQGAYVNKVVYDVERVECAGIHASGCYGNPFFKRDIEDQDWLEHFALRNPRFYTFWKLTSNCGRSLSRVVLFSLGIALFFGGIYAQKFWPLIQIGATEDNWFSPFYYSIVTFTTLGYGDITPSCLAGQLVVVAEVIVGYISLGILVSILANKVARRA